MGRFAILPNGMKRWETAGRMIGLGWYVGVSIFLGVAGGIWLDKKLNSSPFLMIIGLLLGIIVAFYGVYRMILPNLNGKDVNKDNS